MDFFWMESLRPDGSLVGLIWQGLREDDPGGEVDIRNYGIENWSSKKDSQKGVKGGAKVIVEEWDGGAWVETDVGAVSGLIRVRTQGGNPQTNLEYGVYFESL